MLNPFKNYHKGERCFIIGNGPSLNQIDLSRLAGETTFGTNRIYLKPFIPTYYVCCNPLVYRQFQADIDALQTIKFISGVNLDTSLRVPAFSSPEGPIWEGFTVTYVCLQLAYYMGFSEVILVGCDHDYGPLQGHPNQEVTGGDNGHFSKDYFAGVKWNLPDLRMSELAYSLARRHYNKAARMVWNATARTKLDVFPLIPFNHIARPDAPKVSAIVSAYKAADCIDGLLEDLKAQTLMQSGEVEIVAACQQNSYEHTALLAAQHDELPVTIITTPDIPTIYKAWNLCVAQASGLYLTNANTDDRHHPRAYELAANILDGRPDIDLVYHDSFITWDDGDSFSGFLQSHQGQDVAVGRVPGQPGIFAWPDYSKAMLKQGCYIGPQPMWRASLHQRYGCFNEEYESAGDYDFWLRCAGERNYYHLPQALGLYHASRGGVEMSNPARAAREARAAQADNMAGDFGINFDNPDYLRVYLGSDMCYLKREDFLDVYDWIRYGGDPKEAD